MRSAPSARPASSGVQPPPSRSRCTARQLAADAAQDRAVGDQPLAGDGRLAVAAGTAGPAPSSAISAGEDEQHAADHREQVGAERALIDVAEGLAAEVSRMSVASAGTSDSTRTDCAGSM